MSSPKEMAMALYTTELEKLGYTVDNDLLNTIVNGLGIAAYDAGSDASLVSGKDEAERAVVIEKLFVNKLGIDDEAQATSMLDAALEKYGMSNPRKYRVVLYYIVVTDNDLVEAFTA
jgi:ABC-type proline/glycine betaine transport system substrate-binding protein